MSVLFLGDAESRVLAHLRAVEDRVEQTAEPLDPAALGDHDWLVSHGYRHIVREPVLSRYPGRIVNLHISLLPFNRGADPNLWSWIDDTPKGVTIHLIDAGVDTGDVLAQREVALDAATETLASSYGRLQDEMLALFAETWPAIRAGRVEPRPQRGAGTTHRVRDRAAVEHLLSRGWETPVADLRRR